MGSFERAIITGNLLDVCHPAALEPRLHSANIRCFDLGIFAEPLRNAMRNRALTLARAAGLEVEFIQRRNFREEEGIAAILQCRGDHPGLVHVFSALEPCLAFRPWHDKTRLAPHADQRRAGPVAASRRNEYTAAILPTPEISVFNHE